MVDANTVRDTQSVLDKLAVGVTERKAAKGAKLTPTVGEKAVTPSVSFPYDNPETMIRALRVARTEVVHVLDGIDAVLFALGGTPDDALTVDKVAEKKATEKAADEAHVARVTDLTKTVEVFGNRFIAQQAEAQAAVFRLAGEVPPEDEPAARARRIAALKAQLEEME